MDRNEFVSTLRAALTGEVPDSAVEENVRYYNSYISQEIASGKTEEEVLESLGDPRLIARTIIDTQTQEYRGRETYGSFDAEEGGYGSRGPGDRQPEQKGFHAEFRDDGGVDIKYKRFNFNTWYGKLLLAAVVILILVLVVLIIGGIVAWVLPVLLPVLLIFWLIRIFFSDR